jgi:hypothetical protein
MAIGNLQILLDFSRVANLVVDEVCEQRLSTRIILRYVDQLKASHGDKWLKPCGVWELKDASRKRARNGCLLQSLFVDRRSQKKAVSKEWKFVSARRRRHFRTRPRKSGQAMLAFDGHLRRRVQAGC